MIPTTYAVPSERSSPIFAAAFARGCGGPIEQKNRLRAGPVALFGSPQRWTLLEEVIRQGRTYYYGDHAYMNRRQFFRITKNALQHSGSGVATPERFQALGRPVQPWRRDGYHILICPNSPTYFRLFGMDVHAWVRDVTAKIAAVSNRPVRVRWKGQDTPIASDLEHCWAVVVFSSAAAIDALIAGVPVFTLADFASTYRMGTHDLTRIENPVYPDDREPFLWNLAANQWTLEEIRNGIAWRALQSQQDMAHAG